MNEMASVPCELEAGHARAGKPRNSRRITALERNNMHWEAHKDKIQSLYVDQDMTLKATMAWFEVMRQFVKSERKWKEKVKEWGFEKNIPSRDMSFMVAKAEKRKSEGKETIFYRCGTQINENKMKQFKRRRLVPPGNETLQDLPAHKLVHTEEHFIQPKEGIVNSTKDNEAVLILNSRPNVAGFVLPELIISSMPVATKITGSNLSDSATTELQRLAAVLHMLETAKGSRLAPESLSIFVDIGLLHCSYHLQFRGGTWEEKPLSAVPRLNAYEAALARLIYQYNIRSLVEQSLHLRLLKSWSALLSTIRCTYQALDLLEPDSPKEFRSAQILLIKSIILSIPRPLGQHIPLEQVEEILYLDNKLLEFVTFSPQDMRGPQALGWIEQEDIVSEDNSSTSDEERNSDEENEVVMRDIGDLVEELQSSMESRSSRRYGETYTESANTESRMMGITFDYSNLFP